MEQPNNRFIDIEHAEMSFPTKKGAFQALVDVNLTVRKGEFITEIGWSTARPYDP